MMGSAFTYERAVLHQDYRLGACVNTLDHSLTRSKPNLLLHICCAPCSTHVIELLREEFAITVFFYNPNIYPPQEHHHRLREARRLCRRLGVDFLAGGYDVQRWSRRMKGRRRDSEGGPYCSVCFWIRLARTARFAQERDFDYFATSLTISPHKDAGVIQRAGHKAARVYGARFYAADFKKRDGFRRSCQLSEKFGLYRQDYCGCVHSLHEREHRRAAEIGHEETKAGKEK
jgi:predicted adenine nucleotide alpha hydrolase (AANH) superfamily ATPase